jgi:hypothetical protein
MKSPAEYVELARSDSPSGPALTMFVADAEAAVATALADAERYRLLLVTAILKSKPASPSTDAPASN